MANFCFDTGEPPFADQTSVSEALSKHGTCLFNPFQYAFHKPELLLQLKAHGGVLHAGNLIVKVALLLSEEISHLLELI
ncbi:MAG: hypothetical protein ABSE85_04190 [Candidatus Korobacteraceae bacterium]